MRFLAFIALVSLLSTCALAEPTKAQQTASGTQKQFEIDDQVIAENVPTNYRQRIADEIRLALKDPHS